MMRIIYTLLLVIFFSAARAQNNARLLSVNGSLFKVYMNDRAVNPTAQASLLLENLKQDTLYIKVEFENEAKYGATLYLLEKGLPAVNKEFNYMVASDKNKVTLDFTGSYDIRPLPNPIVPKKLATDTSDKYSNIVLEHFCEIKDRRPVYFNNLPKEGPCASPMPDGYLNYTALLIQKAKSPDDKYSIAENVCRNNCLSVAQLNTLLTYSDYELDRLKLVKLSYFNLTDAANQKELEKSFRLEASVNDLNTFLKNPDEYKIRVSNTCVKASPEEEITKLGDNLAVFSIDAQRLALLKKTHDNYCFSVTQISSLLRKFLHDREKLDAAKLLYFNCINKADYIAVGDVFSYSQPVTELKNFLEKQGQ